MIVNNCKNIKDYDGALKKMILVYGGLVKLLIKIVINKRVLFVFMIVNNCKKIEDYVSTLNN